MRVNILFDDRRIERYEPLAQELWRQGVQNYEIFPCILRGNVVESINLSQRMIVQQAKDRGESECVIWEDDVWFPAEDGWEYFLNNKPKVFDVYIGGSYLIDDRLEYKPPVVKVNEWVGNHCIIIHERYYDRFLATPPSKHIDSQTGGDFYLCYPMPALQRPGFSANNHAHCNYNATLKEQDVYGKFK